MKSNPISKQERETWRRQQRRYENRAFTVFKKAVRKSIENLDPSTLTEKNYALEIPRRLPRKHLKAALRRLYLEVGLDYAVHVKALLDKSQTSKANPLLDRIFEKFIVDYFFDTAGDKIKIMHESLAKTLVKSISDFWEEREEDQTWEDVIRAVYKVFRGKDYYRWQIRRIVRTESGTAASVGARAAAEKAQEETGIELVKMWLSTDDKRTRQHERGDEFDHWDMDGKVVLFEHDFKLESKDGRIVRMREPHDPRGGAENVINCRCIASYRPRLDKNGEIM